MAENFHQLSNAEFVIWMNNMLSVIQTNNAVINMEQTLIDDSKAKVNSLSANLNEKQSLEDNLAGKMQEIKINRQDANKKAARIHGLLKYNDNVAQNLLEQAGFNINDAVRSTVMPQPPVDLVVTGTSDGTNRLKWGRNGNKQGALFLIEAKTEGGGWTIIDTVTNSKYEHTNQTPGVKIQYRIKAKRANNTSTSSNIAIVYG